ncbi:hypothetical protein TrVE_jg11472 [Triparma verrucosa]|uniref:Uncharacterized protein n=1 Tax=Triparma verrucosa TaxID=1606542 RepID=A0A9W7C0P4_9STRA|nr:hypothetical protein TrVE_jg11472 [Triparma verrucosa]
MDPSSLADGDWDGDSDSSSSSSVDSLIRSEQVRLRLIGRYLSHSEKKKKKKTRLDLGHEELDLEARLERLERLERESPRQSQSPSNMSAFTAWMADAQDQIDEWKDLLLKRETGEASLLEKVGEILEEQGLQQLRQQQQHIISKMAASMEKKDKQIETLVNEVMSLRSKLEKKEKEKDEDEDEEKVNVEEEVSEKKVDEKEEVVAKSKPKRSNSAMYDLAAMDGVMWADDNAEDKNDVNQSDVSLTDIITSLWK